MENGILYSYPTRMRLASGAAYNPVTGAFLRGSAGDTHNDLGRMLAATGMRMEVYSGAFTLNG